ncbi:MAG: cupin domain-containing protein [Azospirillaceae bacterium]
MTAAMRAESGRFDPIDPERLRLASLLAPVDQAHFFEKYWEKDILVVTRDRPDYLARCLTLDEIDQVITTQTLHNDALSLVDAKREIKAEEYCFPSGMVDPARLYGFFHDGATIILPQLHLRVASLADITRAMEAELGHRFQTNVYFTPPGQSQGFRPHFDNHDVFVLQVAGSKSWKIYDTPIPLPDRHIDFNPETYRLAPVTREFTLHAGDVAYVPRGVVHDAVSTDEMSLHITLGALVRTWADAFRTAIDAINLNTPAFREALPPGFHRPGTDRAAARLKAKALLELFVEGFNADALLGDFAQELVESRHGLLRGQLQQVQRLDDIGPASRAAARPNLLYEISHDADGVSLFCYGQELRFPAHAAATLEAALSPGDYAVGELPGEVDDQGKVVLVRRLVREGLVRLSD